MVLDGGFQAGGLVKLCGLKTCARLSPGLESVGGEFLDDLESANFNGALAQLVEYHDDLKRWFVVTMDGVLLQVREKNLRLAGSDDLGQRDLVMGPTSELEFAATELAQCLSDKGYANIQLVLAAHHRAELLEVADVLESDGLFSRLADGIEAGYLGRGGRGKTLMLDLQHESTPAVAKASNALVLQDMNFGAISGMLAGYAEEHMDFVLHSRTPLMFRKTFASTADASNYMPPTATPTEVDHFLGIMHRKRICLLEFIGPDSGTVTLISRDDDEAKPIKIAAHPGTLLVFMCSQYDYQYVPQGQSLVIQAWFLEEPPTVTFQGDVLGDLALLDTSVKGPPMPKVKFEIAMTGMGVREPAVSDNASMYWNVFRHAGADGFQVIPMTRYDLEFYAEWRADRQTALNMGKMYCRHQGHCEGLELFDASFFNVSNSEAKGMDPEQRMVLENGWKAMHEAGYTKDKCVRSGAHVGVYVAQNESDWPFVPLPPDAACGMGSVQAIIAGRFTFVFNLKGPCTIMNTACSSGLTALHNAKLVLCYPHDPVESFLVCGVSMNTTPNVFMGNCSTSALSFMGRSFTFDKGADGFGRSEGATGCVWKLLPWSEEVYGMLAGSGLNHDGRSASLSAPNGPAQERAIRSVLEEVKIDPPEIDCFECHGTGTSLGDPIEVGAFKRLYNRKPRFTAVLSTSSKSNIGHTEANAGLAGFMKCILMVMHCECPSNIHLREQNPHLDTDGFPNFFVSEAVLMTANSCYAGVSSFGVSGTNGHCLAYGKNSVTTRAFERKNPKYVMLSLIRSAVPDVIQTHEGWESWENTGMPHCNKPDTEYEIEVVEGGKVLWHEVEKPQLRKREGPFYITGSFNEWKMEQMVSDDSVDGLHVVEVEIGEEGQESFQIVCDEDRDLAFFPDTPGCTRKTASILGPEPAPSREDSWVICGEPETYFRVEFFIVESGTRTTINWMPIKD